MACFSDLIDKSTKVLNIGFHSGKILRVEVSLTRKERGPVLSIQRMIGRNHSGWNHDSIDMEKVEYLNGWDAHKLGVLIQVWKRWHLNDLRAGSPAQMQHLRAIGNNLQYEQSCEALRAVGLYVDDHFRWGEDTTGFRYGSAWVYEPLPESVIEWFNGL